MKQGCSIFEIAQRILPINHFVIFGAWKDGQAYGADLAAAYTKQGAAALASQLIAPIDTQVGKRVVREDLQAPPARVVYAITHIAVVPERVNDFYAARLSPRSIRHPGGLEEPASPH
jgi:hypothetical protein